MTTIAQVETAVISWARAATGLSDVIRANQATPQPAEPYLTFQKTTGPIQIGQDEITMAASSTGLVTVIGQRELTYSFNWLGAGSLQGLDSARLNLSLPSVVEDFKVANIGVRAIPTAVTDLTFLQETAFQERAQMDVTWGYGFSVTEDASRIEIINGTLTLTDGIDDHVETFDAIP